MTNFDFNANFEKSTKNGSEMVHTHCIVSVLDSNCNFAFRSIEFANEKGIAQALKQLDDYIATFDKWVFPDYRREANDLRKALQSVKPHQKIVARYETAWNNEYRYFTLADK